MTGAVVHLFGFPGAGKLTVARSLAVAAAERGRHLVVVDNHLTANAVLSVVDVPTAGRVPREVWDRVDGVREVVYGAIEDLSPASWSFAFTNVLTEHQPDDLATAERVELLAARRGARYLPVRLECRTDELLRRVVGADRAARLKWTDAGAVGEFVEERTLLDLPGRQVLALDTSSTPPEDVARSILDELDRG